MPEDAARPPAPSRHPAVPLLRAVALASGLFCAVVGTLLILNHRQSKALDPLNSVALIELSKKAATNPADTNLVAEARAMDLLARRAFFSSQDLVRRGAWMVLAGSLLLLGSLKGLTALDARRPPRGAMPCCESAESLSRSYRRGAVAFGVAVLAASGFALVAGREKTPTTPVAAPAPTAAATTNAQATAAVDRPTATPAHAPVPAPGPAPGPAAGGAADAATEAEMAANWPAFRGHRGLGGGRTNGFPVKWNGETGEGVAWKVEVPRAGAGSPIVWGDRIFLSGGDETARELFCFDAATGALRWRHAATDIPGSPAEMPTVSEDAGLAAATMATDGRRVFAVFATGDLVCCDPDGKRVWARNLGVPKNPYGYSSSPIAFGGRLYVQYDQEEGARLLALDPATGRELWSVARQVKPSWASPIVADAGGKPLLVTFGNPSLTAYDPADGKQVWTVPDFEAEVAASPASADGRVFAGNEYARFAAFEAAGGKQLWSVDEDLPEVSAPLPVNGLVIIATSGGMILCRDAATGAKHWSKEFDEGFYGSPMAAGGRVYLADRKGLTRVFEAGKTWNLLAENPLGEKGDPTPVFVGSRIYLRGQKHLMAIGAK